MGRFEMTYHTLTDYGREVTATTASFRPVSEISSGPFPSITPFPLYKSPFHYPTTSPLIPSPFSIYLIPAQDVGNALVTSLGFRTSMGGEVHILSGVSQADLLF
ncbi:hypothetical protein EVAR_95267_1 [Eumeta japonica]|uniref:Uncharacterized protein n=1 Tax=Eumeta variegata TaxID=151549 RepID=A0A4C1UK00_EUMVA|nr:hypothetical protein EVAR_95267_1 [Eumeta japonica]